MCLFVYLKIVILHNSFFDVQQIYGSVKMKFCYVKDLFFTNKLFQIHFSYYISSNKDHHYYLLLRAVSFHPIATTNIICCWKFVYLYVLKIYVIQWYFSAAKKKKTFIIHINPTRYVLKAVINKYSIWKMNFGKSLLGKYLQHFSSFFWSVNVRTFFTFSHKSLHKVH